MKTRRKVIKGHAFVHAKQVIAHANNVGNGNKGILNDIMECNAFLFTRTLNKVYFHWFYTLVISHKCNELDLELKDGGDLTLC
jgi:hypothetical protein